MDENKLSIYIGSKIKELRKKKKITQNELGKKIGVKNNTISAYERGAISTDQDILFRLADALNVSINDFFPNTTNNVIQFPASSKYPIYPSVSAGVPVGIDGVTEIESETISIPDYLLGKWAGNRDIYFTRTNGESMNKIMPHDTLIAVKQVELHELKDNDIVVYRNHGEYAVKRFYKDGDRLIFKPDSTDNRFADDVINVNDADDLTISGKVVTYIVNVD